MGRDMGFGFRRTDRVGDLLHAEIADVLLRRVKDPRIGFVTVTGIKVSPDLRHATVFVSLLDDGEIRRETLKALERASGFVRAEVGRRMRLKYTPELVFRFDETPSRAARLEAVLDELGLEGAEIGRETGDDVNGHG